MIDTDAPCVINGLHVTAVNIMAAAEFKPTMNISYLLTSTKAGQLRLQTQKNVGVTSNWSSRTKELLEELIESIETDLLPRHFKISEGMEDTDVTDGTQLGGIEKTPQI